MKKMLAVLFVLALACTAAAQGRKNTCATIQSRTLITSAGDIVTPGYDKWGYNYQAHMFNGNYCDAYWNAAWCQPYKDDSLTMKWNDAWLSNMDCDGDGVLDRHSGFSSYAGSGAWLTNHQSGTYKDEAADGKECNWTYFVKIVAVPADAISTEGVWSTTRGDEIGPAIWGEFAIIQEVFNDTCAGLNRKQYVGPVGPGFGKFKP